VKTNNKLIAIMLVALLATSTLNILIQPAKAADRFFTASISPTTMYAGLPATYTVTISNIQGTGIGTANVTIPLGFTDVTTPTSVSTSGVVWEVWFQEFDKISLKPVHPSETLGSGESLLVTFEATAPSSPGSYAWIVYCTTNTGLGGQEFAISGVQPFLTVTPILDLNPASGHVGQEVFVTGSNFAPSSQITFTYDTSELPISIMSTSSGLIPSGVTFFVPPSTAGTHQVTATDESSNSVSEAFTVIPFIQLSINAGPEGTSVGVFGNGFAANSHLTATFDGALLTLGGIVNTDSTGSFNGATFSVPSSTLGSKTVTITDAALNLASAPFSVGQASPSIIAHLSANSITAGDSVAISSSMSQATSNYGGTITYTLYNAISSAEIDIQQVLITAGVIPDGVFSPNIVGTYYFTATYSGDDNNYGATSSQVPLTVIHSNVEYITASINPESVAAPGTVTGTAIAYDSFGNNWDISTVAVWSIPAGNDGGSWLDNVYTSNNAGIYTVRAIFEGKSATAALTVTHATDVAYLDHIEVSLSSSSVAAPGTVTATATAFDVFGNSWDVSGSAAWSISVGAGGSWSGVVYTSEMAGEWIVTGIFEGKSATAALTVTHANLDHFEFAAISSPKTAGLQFTITITAKDHFGNRVTSYAGLNMLSDSTGTISPTSIAFEDGIWSGYVTLTSPSPAVTITTSDSSNHVGISNSFELYQYIITAKAGAHGSVSPSGTMGVAYGESQEFTFTPDAGYHIANVLVNATSVLSSVVDGKYMLSDVTGDTNLAVSYAINTYDVAVTAGIHGSSNVGSQVVDWGTVLNFAFTSDLGYHVAGVLVNGSSLGVVDSLSITVTGSTTVEVSFAINTYSVSVAVGAHGSSNIGSQTVDWGSMLNFAFTPDTGYHVADVIVNGSSVGAVGSLSITVTGSTSAAVNFAINTYTITVIQAENGIIAPGTTIVNYGGSQSFTITPAKGYHVVDVLADGVSKGPIDSWNFTNVQAAHSITAVFEIDQFNITASTGANGAINPSGAIAVDYGSSQTFTITPNYGYHISSLSINNTAIAITSQYTITDVTGNTVIYATFTANPTENIASNDATPKTYNIKVIQNTHGTITPAGTISVNAGASQSFTINANEGYHIINVVIDGISKGALSSWSFTNINSDHTLTANFAINTYIINATTSFNGTITPNGITLVAHGDNASFSIKADEGFHITDVLVDGVSVGTDNEYNFTNVTDDHTLTVAFAANGLIVFSLWWILLIIILFAIITLILMLVRRRKKGQEDKNTKTLQSETNLYSPTFRPSFI